MGRLRPQEYKGQTSLSPQDIRDASTPQGTAQINEEFRRIDLAIKNIAQPVQPPTAEPTPPPSEPSTQVPTTIIKGSEPALTVTVNGQLASRPKKVQVLDLNTQTTIPTGYETYPIRFETTRANAPQSLSTIENADTVTVKGYVDIPLPDEEEQLTEEQEQHDYHLKIADLYSRVNPPINIRLHKPFIHGSVNLLPLEWRSIRFQQVQLSDMQYQIGNNDIFVCKEEGTYNLQAMIMMVSTAPTRVGHDIHNPLFRPILGVFKNDVFFAHIGSGVYYEMDLFPAIVSSNTDPRRFQIHGEVQGSTLVPLALGDTIRLKIRYPQGYDIYTDDGATYTEYGFCDIFRVGKFTNTTNAPQDIGVDY